jgi:hypothetical protein
MLVQIVALVLFIHYKPRGEIWPPGSNAMNLTIVLPKNGLLPGFANFACEQHTQTGK